MDCPICERLAIEHERLEQIYAVAIGHLSSRRDKTRAEDYTALRNVADEARSNSEAALFELEKHRRIHRKAN